jgi:enamine deaminase RidA (YjgF/YER057c/UK114 family)
VEQSTVGENVTEPRTAQGEAIAPFAKYSAYRLTDDRLYISGQVAFRDGGFPYRGRVGGELDIDEGRAAARICALNVLAHAADALGSLDRIDAVLKVTVFVSAAPDFVSHHLVADGASEAFVEVLGERGRHARSAVGSPRLPMDSPVEVEVALSIRS